VEHVNKIVPAQVFVRQGPENKVNDRSGALDIRVFHHAGGLETGEYEFLHKFFQWHAVLQADRHRDGKTVQHAAHGGAFLGHVDKDLSHGAIAILAGTQKKRLSVDLGLLGEPPAFAGEG